MLVALSCISFASADNPCKGLYWGQKVPHAKCQYYYACYLTIPTRRYCGYGKIFDPKQSKCVEGDRETCETGGHETTTTTEAPTTLPPPTLEEICEGVFFAARPHYSSNVHFVGCIRGKGLLFECSENEVFSRFENECVKNE